MTAMIIKWPDVLSSIFWQGLISTVDCGRTVGCLRSELGCNGTDCDYAATYIYQPSTKVVTIEMFGKGADWVAIGFSDNQAMVWIKPLLFKWPIWPIFICQNNPKSDKFFVNTAQISTPEINLLGENETIFFSFYQPQTHAVFCYNSNGNVALESSNLQSKSSPTLEKVRERRTLAKQCVFGMHCILQSDIHRHIYHNTIDKSVLIKTVCHTWRHLFSDHSSSFCHQIISLMWTKTLI